MRSKQNIILSIIIVLAIICTVCLVIGIGQNNDVNIQNVITSGDSGVTMEIKEETLTKTGATIVLQVNDGTEYSYGRWFRIDKKENGKWRGLEPIDENYVFDAIGLILKPYGETEEKIDWSQLYGELEKGEYRLVKNISGKYIGTEFVID